MTKYKAIKVDGVKHDYHRWLMEKELGRKLNSDEVVHHKNGDPLDNTIDNLQVMTRSEHAKLHAKPPYFPDSVYDNLSERLTGKPAINRKLTEEDVMFIKEHYIPKDKEYGARALGRKYGIRHQSILKIINGEYYKNFNLNQ